MQRDYFINIHTHFKSKQNDAIIVRNGGLLDANVYHHLPYLISVGLHPWKLNQMTVNECVDALINLSTLDTLFAIGEIGIDRAIDIPLKTQLNYFEAQLTIARAVGKPVILHAVRSYSDFLPYQKKTKIPFIYHGFNGNLQQAKELIKYGAYLSFGKGLWHPKTKEVFNFLPLEQVFLETDNDPSLSIEHVYEQAALIKNMEKHELKYLLYNNFVRLKK